MMTTNWRCTRSHLWHDSCWLDFSQVRIVHCQGWPHSAGALHKVFNAVSIVQAWHLEYQNGPLVLVDRWTFLFPESSEHYFPIGREGQRRQPLLPWPPWRSRWTGSRQWMSIRWGLASWWSELETRLQKNANLYLIFFQVCKLLHNKRPGVWRGQEDYLYIHKVGFNHHQSSLIS